MNPVLVALIESLHAAPCKYVLALSGGGTMAAANLLNVPGGARTILEVRIPYDDRALVDFLGRQPQQACSLETARALAARAYERALWLAPGSPILGLGATASLATDRPKRGDHRLHVAACSASAIRSYSLILAKGARDRIGEEAVLDTIILTALAHALDVATTLPIALLDGEHVDETTEPLGGLGVFFRREIKAVCVQPHGQATALEGGLTRAAPPAVLLAGAFDPVHEGHWALAAAAERILGKPVAFELSLDNVDKPSLPFEEARRRLAPFSGRASVWLTRAPTFVEKAQLFPGVVFVVGVDTAERIVAARYYSAGEAGVSEALALFRRQRCRFLVAGRVDAAGTFHGLRTVPLPGVCDDLFTAIPETAFRADISSTELRRVGETSEV